MPIASEHNCFGIHMVESVLEVCLKCHAFMSALFGILVRPFGACLLRMTLRVNTTSTKAKTIAVLFVHFLYVILYLYVGSVSV